MALQIRAVSSTSVPTVTLFPVVLLLFLIIVEGERIANIKIETKYNNEPNIQYTKYLRDPCSGNTGQYVPHIVCSSRVV